MSTDQSLRTAAGEDIDDHDDFGGFQRDMPHLLGRRRLLQAFGVAGAVGLLVACGTSSSSGTDTTAAGTTGAGTTGTGATGAGTTGAGTTGAGTTGAATTGVGTTAASSTAAGTSAATTAATAASPGAEIPDETEGPFPADGSNGPNVLTESGVVRSDLRTSFGTSSGTAPGVVTALQLTVVDAATGSPIEAAAVYAWHCTADGQYSVYQVTDQNYLRGVQATDAAGRVAFTTVFPGCYSGRWPHVHFEVYENLEQATRGSQAMKISQLALPQADAEAVYAESDYGSSASNLARTSLTSDGIFRDGWTDQLATVSGSVAQGYTASLLVRV